MSAPELIPPLQEADDQPQFDALLALLKVALEDLRKVAELTQGDATAVRGALRLAGRIGSDLLPYFGEEFCSLGAIKAELEGMTRTKGPAGDHHRFAALMRLGLAVEEVDEQIMLAESPEMRTAAQMLTATLSPKDYCANLRRTAAGLPSVDVFSKDRDLQKVASLVRAGDGTFGIALRDEDPVPVKSLGTAVSIMMDNLLGLGPELKLAGRPLF